VPGTRMQSLFSGQTSCVDRVAVMAVAARMVIITHTGVSPGPAAAASYAAHFLNFTALPNLLEECL
jgi:hypothetical protein